jgi:hypothetical protein
MERDQSREMTAGEVDLLPMEQIDKIAPRLPYRDYRTEKEPDGTSRRIIRFPNGGRFEVI